MNFDIKTIEDLSLNAWPSHQMQVYDGWIIRFSYFYTHRTNSVEQIGPSTLPLKEKIDYCEKIYQRWQTPSVFKISPVTDARLEPLLTERGYHIEHSTNVMALDLTAPYIIEETPPVSIRIQDHIAPGWLDALFSLKHTTSPTHKKIVPSMYAAIPKDVIALSIREDGEIAATGLGILDRKYIGIYAIHVSGRCRHRHYATAMIQTLLAKGREKGASRAYLQVVSDNAPAIALYEKAGFTKVYDYHFRVK